MALQTSSLQPILTMVSSFTVKQQKHDRDTMLAARYITICLLFKVEVDTVVDVD
jgi:hypothetical protein